MQPSYRPLSAPITLALGANLGDRMATLWAAIQALQAEGIALHMASAVYETPPWGYTQQPDFLNAVVLGHTNLPPLALLDVLQAIEHGLGRRATFPNGPRPIDIDLLVYDDLVMQTERLTLPHPRLHERAFVLQPWADIAPNFVVPRLQYTVNQLLATLPEADRHAVRLWHEPLTMMNTLERLAT